MTAEIFVWHNANNLYNLRQNPENNTPLLLDNFMALALPSGEPHKIVSLCADSGCTK